MAGSKQSAGGVARARSLSEDERSDIAKLGAAARWSPVDGGEDVQKAIFGKPDKMLKIGDVSVECYVLEDFTRVLSGRGMQQAIGLGGDAGTHGGKLREFLALKTIEPFVNNNLAMAVNRPKKFIRPGRGGKPAVAFEATLLIDLCETIMAAKDAPGFRKQWIPLVLQAQLITLSFAKAGIVAAVDEVTGYQEVREKNEIQKLLDKYLTDYAQRWAKVFPDEFWDKLLKVKGYESYIGLNRPSFVGHWINDIVYDRLAPGIRQKLSKLNPRTKSGRKYKNHQFLTEDHGVPELKEHLTKAMALMDASTSTDEFSILLDRVLPKFGDTYQLPSI